MYFALGLLCIPLCWGSLKHTTDGHGLLPTLQKCSHGEDGHARSPQVASILEGKPQGGLTWAWNSLQMCCSSRGKRLQLSPALKAVTYNFLPSALENIYSLSHFTI